MKRIIEVYKGLAFQFTQTKLTILSIEQCILKSEYLNVVKFDNDFYNQNTFSNYQRALLSNYSLIQFCSFLEEYKNFNANASLDDELNARVLKVRRKNKYGIKRISQWKDLQAMRNHLIAHNFQIKNKSFFDNNDNQIFKYNIPDTLNEKLVFLNIMEKICMNILDEFPEILNISDIDKYKMGDNIMIIKNYIDLEQEMKLIKENM